jgi:KaiC/GvpD/RAD55 family RecA-like ATPase
VSNHASPGSAYAVAGLPVDGLRAGATVMVAGPAHAGARSVALRLLAGAPGEGAILVTTNQRAASVVEECERSGIEIHPDRAAIIDCVGDEDPDVPARLLPVSGPADLTGIGMRFSDVYREFQQAGIDRVRTGLFSLSTLLTLGDLQTVSRFVHTLVGRIDGVDGLGVLLVDPTTHDEREVGTIAQFCTGRIDVREGDDGPELRVRGLSDHSREWRRFDP